MVFRNRKNKNHEISEEEQDSHDFIADIDISSGEDEEIDEDMAFDEEDEEKYGANFVFSFR